MYVSVISGEYNGYLYDNGKIWLNKNPAELLRNRLRYIAEAKARDDSTNDKTTDNRDRRNKRLRGESCHFEANLFDDDQTTFETVWPEGSVFAGKVRDAGTSEQADAAANARSRRRAERRKKSKK